MSNVTHAIPVDSIVIADEFSDFARDWYSGQSDMLYAIASTGGLTLGNRRPRDCDTDEQWYLQLWYDLDCDLRSCIRAMDNHPSVESKHDRLLADHFADFVSQTIDALRIAYDIDND